MLKMFVAVAMLSLMSGAALGQNTRPAPQSDNMSRPRNTTGTVNDSATTPGTTSGTTGMSTGMNRNGMAHDNMNRDMPRNKRSGMSK
jgi:hypothetical protein